MALVLADRVLETTTSTGSGTITLAGAEPGYQSFSAVGDGNQTYYTITGDTQWEVGVGTYTASGTTLSRDTVLSSSASGAKVGFSAGQKKVFVTYPSEKSVNFDVSGNISVSSAIITNLAEPVVASDAANKLYVDTLAAQGISYHEPVKYEVPNTTGNLTATYNNGTAGVSATLTNAGTLAAFVPDGVTASISDRVLVYNQTNAYENGVYVVSTVGNGSTAWVLTRAADADSYGVKSPTELGTGDAFYVSSGNTGAGETYVCNTPGVIVFGSTAITFAQISSAQVYQAGNGISLTNTTISLATPVSVANGGTGQSAAPAAGEILIGNGVSFVLSTLTAGSGVSITNSAGSITLSATGLGGTVTAVTASAPLASSGGTAPNISVANSTGTGSVVLDQGATIFSATITGAVSASITTITGTSANITTVTGTTAGFSSANITQLGTTSATIATLSGTNVTYSSGTVSQLAATSATIGTVSGTNVSYANGTFTSATVTTVSGTTATYTSATITTVTGNLIGNASTATTASNVNNGTLTMNVSGTGLSGSQTFTANQSTNATFTVTSNATSANTGSTIVARDASGNFSAGTITATLNGNASTATTASNVNNGTLTMNVSGSGLSGSASFTANQSGNSTFTVTSNATTTAGAANTIVLRDGSGYIFNNYFNSTDNSQASGVTAVMVKAGDNYFRSGTAAAVATFISGQTMNINGSSTSCTGNAATVTNGMYLNAAQTSTVRKVFAGSQNVGTLQTGTGGLGGLELISNGVGDAAFMTFHKPGNFAAYFGLDTDNQFAVGGWSSGAGLSNFKCVGLGVGTAASGTAGEIRATNNITAYYSDARLKDFKGKIGDALYKVSQLNGYYYTENEKAEEFGFKNKELQVGVSAQEVKAILPEVIAPAPFDMDAENKSKSGEDYMTVRYEKLVPLLIEAIKELKAEVEALKAGK